MSERRVLRWTEGKGEHWVLADEADPRFNPQRADYSDGDNPNPLDYDDE
ncbi:hypothetical protein OG689_10590 [Kitasatospora sp. NBC_00240]|nr:hypothetical protein [Kitasatospora sp. NBC_00240]MCX5209730.1 hypothetical protein [Kitasatospora sp. NBC_00240]